MSAEDPAATLGAGGVRREAERAGVRELRQRLSESERQLADARDYLQALQEQHDATIADRRQVELFLELQNDALEMVVRGLPLTKALEALTLALEKQSRNKMMAAIHLLDAEGTHLRDCIAPSLPESYRRVTDGVDVNSKMGSCCMAVLGGATFAIEDIAADPQWSAFGGFAAARTDGAVRYRTRGNCPPASKRLVFGASVISCAVTRPAHVALDAGGRQAVPTSD